MMNTLKRRHLMRKYLRPVLGIVIGGLLGLGYYFLIGCKSGQCAITGSPLGSILMGSFWYCSSRPALVAVEGAEVINQTSIKDFVHLTNKGHDTFLNLFSQRFGMSEIWMIDQYLIHD